jgi:hypothetical protein
VLTAASSKRGAREQMERPVERYVDEEQRMQHATRCTPHAAVPALLHLVKTVMRAATVMGRGMQTLSQSLHIPWEGHLEEGPGYVHHLAPPLNFSRIGALDGAAAPSTPAWRCCPTRRCRPQLYSYRQALQTRQPPRKQRQHSSSYRMLNARAMPRPMIFI